MNDIIFKTVVSKNVFKDCEVKYELMASLDGQMFHFPLSRKKFFQHISSDMYQVRLDVLSDIERNFLQVSFVAIPNVSDGIPEFNYEK